MLLILSTQTGRKGIKKDYGKLLNGFKCFVTFLSNSELQSGYLPAAPHPLGYKYKKAVYVEYTDGSFTQRKDNAQSLLGPLLKGKVYDEIHVSQIFVGRK